MLRNSIGLLTLLAATALPHAPVAAAQSCQARPGQSAIEQYCAAVPGPGGNRGSETHGERRGKADGARLSPGARRSQRALEQAGGADEEDLNRFLTASGDQADANASGSNAGSPRSGAGRRTGKGSTEDTAAGRKTKTPAIVETARGSSERANVGVAAAVGASSSSAAKLLSAVAALAVLAGLGVLFVRRRRGPIG